MLMCNPLQKLPLLLPFRLPFHCSLALFFFEVNHTGSRAKVAITPTVKSSARTLSCTEDLLVQTPGSVGPNLPESAPLSPCAARSLITAYWRAD